MADGFKPPHDSGFGELQIRENFRKLEKYTADEASAVETDITALEAADTAILGAYKLLYAATGAIELDATANTYIFAGRSLASGGNFAAGGGALMLHLVAADYAVSGKTAKIRVRASVAANATAPAITFTVGLYPVTVAGGADVMALTAGTVVASSTVAIASPSASTVTAGTASSDISLPTDGHYMLAVVTSGTIANNSSVLISAQVQMRHV